MGRILSKIEAEKTKEIMDKLIDDLSKIKKIMEDDSLSKEEKKRQRDTILDMNLNGFNSLLDQFQIKSIGVLGIFQKKKQWIYLRRMRLFI